MRPRWGRPLFVKKDTNFTHLVADRVTGLDGATYTVLFIGTGRHVHMWAWLMEDYVPETGPLCPLVDTCPFPTPTGDGWLLKAVNLGPWVHLIEELQVFDQEPVESLVLSRSKVVVSAHLPLSLCFLQSLDNTGLGRHLSTPGLA